MSKNKTNVQEMFPHRWVSAAKVLSVVVNGQPTQIERRRGEKVASIMERGLRLTGNAIYGPLSRWETQDVLGRKLDPSQTLPKLHWDASGTLYVNLKPEIA